MDKLNEKTNELTPEQMKTAAGGNDSGKDCYYCPGTQLDDTPCDRPLRQIDGALYRCVNSSCRLFGQNQFPTRSK